MGHARIHLIVINEGSTAVRSRELKITNVLTGLTLLSNCLSASANISAALISKKVLLKTYLSHKDINYGVISAYFLQTN